MFTAKFVEVCRHYVLASVEVGAATKSDVVDAADQLLELTDGDFTDKDSAWAAIQAVNAELIRCGYVGRRIERLSAGQKKSVKARGVAGVINSGLSLVVFNYMSPAKLKSAHNHREVWVTNTLQGYAASGGNVSDLLAKFAYDTGKAADSIAKAPYQEPESTTGLYRVLQKEEVSQLGLEDDSKSIEA